MVDAGLLVTINSGDPPMFGTTLEREYVLTAELLHLDEYGVAELAKNAVAASSFLDASGQGGICAEIDAYAAAIG